MDHPQYAITLSYEFLDDVSLEWAGFVTSEASDHEESGLDAVMYKIKSALPENASKQVEIKSNHPLMLMVSSFLNNRIATDQEMVRERKILEAQGVLL